MFRSRHKPTLKRRLPRAQAEIAADPQEELRALAGIYENHGLSPDLARQVAAALRAKDRLAAHLRDELGFSEHTEAKSLLAADTLALSFAVEAAMPMAAAALVPEATISLWVTATSLAFLAVLGP